jgi:hypothetical protein
VSHVVICVMMFDRPLRSDPLWWFGLVGGAVGGLWRVIAADLTGLDAAWQVLASVIGFTFLIRAARGPRFEPSSVADGDGHACG